MNPEMQTESLLVARGMNVRTTLTGGEEEDEGELSVNIKGGTLLEIHI